MCQLVPSHLSASVNGAESVRCSPTAVQAWPLHATPWKKFSVPERFGVGWMRHPVPFHRSASVPMPLPEASVRAPTAMQTEGDVHATPLRKPPGDEGAGTGWIRHFVPFHRSAKTPTGVPELLKEFPVAVQADDDLQNKPNRALPCAPGGLGVRGRGHRAPSHRAAGVAVKPPQRAVRAPTAAQATADVQDTLARPPPARRLGVGWMRHFAPSHRSAKGRFAASPVAVQADGDVQDTLPSWLGAAPARLGVGWMRHRAPFHRSARVWGMPERSLENPAAVQADGDGQATVFRGANWAPAGVGVGWMRHRVPFHRSARVPALGVKALEAPTAMEDEADTHATPDRTPPPCLGLGVGWMR